MTGDVGGSMRSALCYSIFAAQRACRGDSELKIGHYRRDLVLGRGRRVFGHRRARFGHNSGRPGRLLGSRDHSTQGTTRPRGLFDPGDYSTGDRHGWIYALGHRRFRLVWLLLGGIYRVRRSQPLAPPKHHRRHEPPARPLDDRDAGPRAPHGRHPNCWKPVEKLGFFASTTILLVAGLIAVLGAAEQAVGTLAEVPIAVPTTKAV